MITTLKDSMHYKTIALTALAVTAALTSATAGDWPQFLGPNRNSTSTEKGILRTWPEKGPEVLWTASVGRGFGGPVIKDGKVYLLDRDDKVAVCGRLRSGGLENYRKNIGARRQKRVSRWAIKILADSVSILGMAHWLIAGKRSNDNRTQKQNDGSAFGKRARGLD